MKLLEYIRWNLSQCFLGLRVRVLGGSLQLMGEQPHVLYKLVHLRPLVFPPHQLRLAFPVCRHRLELSRLFEPVQHAVGRSHL